MAHEAILHDSEDPRLSTVALALYHPVTYAAADTTSAAQGTEPVTPEPRPFPAG